LPHHKRGAGREPPDDIPEIAALTSRAASGPRPSPVCRSPVRGATFHALADANRDLFVVGNTAMTPTNKSNRLPHRTPQSSRACSPPTRDRSTQCGNAPFAAQS
jgi:hypothetical protein